MLYRMFHPYLHPDFIFNLSSKGRQHKKYLSILHGFTRKVWHPIRAIRGL
jgi:hypothetical protein